MSETTRKVYLSGPITGYDLAERAILFSYFEEFVNSQTHFLAVNPLRNGISQETESREAHMRTDIRNLLGCDYIYMLPDWHKAEGCRLELCVATTCGITPLFSLEELRTEHDSIKEDAVWL